ncbi:MAG: calcium/sodium antiporter [Halioglobus sp.]|nr:calcium/sodium antiporter [Halioglobus sp.]
MTVNLLFLALGILLLFLGGESLIRGALAAARRLGISPLLSGLVIVGFGTSSPELAVSVDAAINQRPDIAVGNVLGSNIGNILLILGLCAVISPIAVRPVILRRDGVVAFAAAGLFAVLAGDGALGRADAAILLSALAAYLVFSWWSERQGTAPSAELHKAEAGELAVLPETVTRTVIAIVMGLVLLIAGSQALLVGAVGIAEHFRLSEAVIGLTVVAVGTSLPELTVSLIAALRRHADVAIGNILGSNIFNVLCILGVAALLQPLPVHERMLSFDQWIMLGVTALLLVFLYTGKRLSRTEGVMLLAGYLGYVAASFLALG